MSFQLMQDFAITTNQWLQAVYTFTKEQSKFHILIVRWESAWYRGHVSWAIGFVR